MDKDKVIELKKPGEISEDPLTELLRAGARQLIAEAVEAELEAFLAQFAHHGTEQGHRQVVRNGYLPERNIQTGLGPVPVNVPKVRDKSGQGIKFNSTLVPPYLRKTKSVEELLPWQKAQLNKLKRPAGLSSGPFHCLFSVTESSVNFCANYKKHPCR